MGIVIKGITVPALLIKLDKTKSIEENITELEDKLSSAFFRGSMAVVDFNDVSMTEEDKQRLEDTLKKYDTKFLGYKPSNSTSNSKTMAKEKKEIQKSLYEINEKKSLKVINKTLRSGQRIEHDGDILIIGDVNPDAYVIASGNIIVMGTLRGIVHAGASGDETTVVMALKLKPQQLRIGSFFTRSPDDIETPEYPEKAFVRGNQIYIEKIQA
jgi:septum site-determining protein MinC